MSYSGVDAVGWIIFVLWLLTYIVAAFFIRKSKGSWFTTIGGGLLASFVGLFIFTSLKPAIEQLVYPNPSVKDWKVGKPVPQTEFWNEDRTKQRGIMEEGGSRAGSDSSTSKSTVSSLEFGSRWSFIVSRGELECINNAVIMHTSKGTYSINGKAMDRYAGRYPEWREIAKPYPGLESDPSAKMPPPHDLIKKGLALCR